MRLAAIAALALCSACVSYKYERHSAFEPVRADKVAELAIGTSDIGDALARLGAPLYVWEGVDDAIVLAYGSDDSRQWGLNVSVPVYDQANASFKYDDTSSRLEGYILVFDRNLELKIVRAGLLRELGRTVRLRPASVE